MVEDETTVSASKLDRDLAEARRNVLPKGVRNLRWKIASEDLPLFDATNFDARGVRFVGNNKHGSTDITEFEPDIATDSVNQRALTQADEVKPEEP